MQNKILFFFLSILIITSANGAERTLGETVEINLGNEWAKDVRARKFINFDDHQIQKSHITYKDN